MKVRAFITHKCSEHYSDCQDRFSINISSNALSISDGISQSIFSADWAELISTYYVTNGHCDEQDRLFLCSEWMRKVQGKLAELKAQGQNTRMAERMLGMHKGAGATICGVRFLDANNWEGDVLGDSCAILVSKKDSLYDLEILSSEDKAFDNSPDYYDSFPEKLGRGTIKKISGIIDTDHFLLLVTDPFSKFLKDNIDNCTSLVNELLCTHNHDDFCKLVHSWRQNGMHDDDSTLCIIEWDENGHLDIIHKDDITILIQSENPALPNSKNTIPIIDTDTTQSTEEITNGQEVTAEQPKKNKINFHRVYEIIGRFFKHIWRK